MRSASPPPFRIAAGLLLAVLLSVVGCHVLRWRNPISPEALLKRADDLSWLNSWIQAEPLYRQAELKFTQNHQLSKALYARVSEMPAHSEGAIARIVGEKTAGRLLSATSVKVGQGFRLALPVGAYYTWKGSVLEGTPIEPDEHVAFDWKQARPGTDAQLEHAISILRTEELNAGI